MIYLTLTAVTVSPALVLPIPVVRTERGVILEAYFKNWDFPVPGKHNLYRCYDMNFGTVKPNFRFIYGMHE